MSRLTRIVKALATMARVIHAVMLREIKSRFGRHKMGYLWAVLEPTVFVAFFAFLFSFGHAVAPSGMPVVQFMITGFAPFMLFRNTMTQTMGAIETNRVLLTFSQVNPIDLVMARALLEIATLTVVFFLLVGAAHVLGFEANIEDPLRVLIALGCLAVTGTGLGAIFAAVMPFVRSTQQIVSLVAGRPLFFISGLFFTAEMMPREAREILLYNPILHMIEWLRSAFFVEFESRFVSIEYALGAAVGTLLVGLLLQRGLRSRILAAV